MTGAKRIAVNTGLATLLMAVVALATAGALRADDNDRDGDVAALLAAHKNVLRAHLEGDLESWMAGESEDYVVVNRGEVTFPTKAERRARLGPYLQNTTFTKYRDLIEPIVKVSDDGTLGWVIVQVEIAGTREMPNGDAVPVDSVWGWIELYEKRDGTWINVGNVSNMQPAK
jgi:hypothetical protein